MNVLMMIKFRALIHLGLEISSQISKGIPAIMIKSKPIRDRSITLIQNIKQAPSNSNIAPQSVVRAMDQGTSAW